MSDYEAEDAFTRHGDEDVKRFVRWIQEGKRRKLIFGENIADTVRSSGRGRLYSENSKSRPKLSSGAMATEPGASPG
jgi:hypothetical protein